MAGTWGVAYIYIHTKFPEYNDEMDVDEEEVFGFRDFLTQGD